MAVKSDDVRSESQSIAGALLGDVDRIAERSAARMQALLPSYGKVPHHQVTPVVVSNTRNVLEAISHPAADHSRERQDYWASGETRLRQGITSDDMLHAWRIGLEVVREEAHAVADGLGIGAKGLLEFVEATLRWGDIGMRASASAHHEVEVGELERLAAEQAALRRVATLVARACSPGEVFAKVAEEVGRLLGAEGALIHRFEPDGDATVVGSWGSGSPVGSRRKLEGHRVVSLVYQTQRPVRLDDPAHGSGAIATGARGLGVRSAVGSPIVVNGRLWGAIAAAASRPDPMPSDAEPRIAQFTELVATAISNVQARSDLAASRARIVAAADGERRRVVRDLHDGAQQRLVHTVVTLKLARRALEQDRRDAAKLVDEALQHAQTATDELRELSHGILPSVLTHGGLRAAVKALASRMPIPVDIEVSVDRLPPEVEATAYFIVAEALTNVAKHAQAQRAMVNARLDREALQVAVRDDGVGGARADGAGLLGLRDRVAVLDGTLRVHSAGDGGTLIAASIPIR